MQRSSERWWETGCVVSLLEVDRRFQNSFPRGVLIAVGGCCAVWSWTLSFGSQLREYKNLPAGTGEEKEKVREGDGRREIVSVNGGKISRVESGGPCDIHWWEDGSVVSLLKVDRLFPNSFSQGILIAVGGCFVVWSCTLSFGYQTEE